MATERTSAYAVTWIPETTAGVDPGIVTAAFVDGTSETTLYQPQAAGTPYKAWVRLASAPEGLPSRPMVAAEQLYPTNDFDPHMVKGNRDEGEFTLTMNLHGSLVDPVTNRPVPPPWLRFCASACGRLLGHVAGQSGGGNGSTHNSLVKDVAPDADYFEIDAGAGTVGALDEGHVFGVDFGTGAAVQDVRLVRPSFCAAATEFGDVSTTTEGAAYNGGTAFGFDAAPAENDRVLFSCQSQFDRRYETATESFTFLVMRPNTDSAMLLRGCRAKSFELMSNFNEIPQVKVTFLFHDYLTFGEDGTAGFGGTPTIVDEPDYYSQWPCPMITGSANMAYINDQTVVRDLAISNLTVKWESGYTRQHSNMAVGTYALRSTEKQDVEVRFTCLYRDDWRDILGACQPMDGIYGSFPLIYWQGTKAKDIWYFALPAMSLKADMTPDGDFEGNQATEIVLGQRRYTGDNGNFASTTTVDNKFAIGVLADE